MLPMRFFRLQIGELFAAASSVWTINADPLQAALVIQPFSPNENMVIGDLTLASFTGSANKACQPEPQQAGVDPSTQEQVITVLAPAGGWRWECTAAPMVPQVIYGFCLVSSDLSTLVAVATLTTPVTITEVGDFVDLGAIEMRFVLQPLS